MSFFLVIVLLYKFYLRSKRWVSRWRSLKWEHDPDFRFHEDSSLLVFLGKLIGVFGADGKLTCAQLVVTTK